MLPTLDRLREFLHWDRALSYAMATRIWQSLSGPITVVMLIRALTPQEQGIYYGIVSIAGIQTIFELGLLSILITQTGHEIGVIRRHQANPSGNDTKSSDATSSTKSMEDSAYRIRQLIEGAEKWFFGASLLFLIVAFVFGYRLLLQSEPSIPWLYPFSVLLVCTMITISLSPHLAILEGAGFRDAIYRARFFQMMLGNLAVWIALGTGLGLWSLAFSAGVQTLVSALVLQVQGKEFFTTYRSAKKVHQDFSWFRNIVPFQWRIAAISMTHYFATQLFAVIVLRFHSSSEAGRLGMTISVA